jgi:hypothetical protein
LSGSTLYQYIVVIRNEQTRYVNAVGFILCILSALAFLRELLIRDAIVLPYLIGIIFIVGFLIYIFFQSRKEDTEIYFSKGLLLSGLVWTKMPYFQWMIFVFALLALLEYQAKHPLEIGFSSRQIVFNTLFKKKYSWDQLSNVILKDGLLTVDFTSNKIFQREIDEGESEASEEEFNTWCREQLETVRSSSA